MSLFAPLLKTDDSVVAHASAWERTENWTRLRRLIQEGRFPQTCALVSDEAHHSEIVFAVARRLLCENRHGDDGCSACAAWSDGHPDLIFAGAPSKPATIDVCRDLIHTMAFRPVVSPRRVAVFFAADKMLLPAANSLLKLAEEPPEHVFILFLLTDEKLFLPTLKSRSWMISLTPPKAAGGLPAPGNNEEWIQWIENFSNAELDELITPLIPWITHAIDREAYGEAAKFEHLRLLAQTKRLSRTMLLDLIVMALKEDIDFEHAFGNFW